MPEPTVSGIDNVATGADVRSLTERAEKAEGVVFSVAGCVPVALEEGAQVARLTVSVLNAPVMKGFHVRHGLCY